MAELTREQKLDLIKQKISSMPEDERYTFLSKYKDLAKEETKPNISKGESVARGFSQGATFGFQDELSPFVEKYVARPILNPFIGGAEAYDDRPTSDLQKTYREQNEAAKAANRKAFLTGDVLGGLSTTAPLMFTGAPAASVAGKTFTKAGGEIIKQVAKRGALEGGAMGALSGAGTAEDNKLLSGAIGGVLGAVLGGGAAGISKPILDKGAQILGRSVQAIQRLPNEIREYLEKNPQQIDRIRKLSGKKDEAIDEISQAQAANLTNKIKDHVTKENEIIDRAIDASGDATLAPEPVIAAFDDKIAQLERGGISNPVRSAIAQLNTMKRRFLEKARTGGLTAGSVNEIRKEMNALASPAYQQTIGNNPVLAKSADDVADSLRLLLDDVSEDIRSANLRLSKSIKVRQEVAKRFGAKSLERSDANIDQSDVQKILTSANRENKISDRRWIKELDGLFATGVEADAKLIQVLKSVSDDGIKALTKTPTGLTNYLPGIGGSLGALGGLATGSDLETAGKLGLAGTALGAVLNSKAGLSLLLKGEKIRGLSEKASDQIRRGLIQKLTENETRKMEFEPRLITPGGK